ncbi:MAG: tetratricopeptide repeat protein, partial [Sandaracinaceae bacterium]|nr:tetratricopeptide repeat protein [Sandaracinaceae bacterium]
MKRTLTVALASWLVTASAAAQVDLSFLDVPPRPRAPATSPEVASPAAELDGALTRYGERAADYRASVDSLLERRARARRRATITRYAASVRDARRREARARREAIERLEEFVRRHPDEARHTPQALLRLAELYVERAYDAPGDTLELGDVIAAARRVVERFAASPHRERAAYLLAWALAQSGGDAEAVALWRSLVCPEATPTASRHPALFAPGAGRAQIDPYAGCPAPASALATEVWLRLGEHHFEAADLGAAIGALRRVVARPDDRLYALGLYVLAWSEYRAGRYAEAIEHFAALVTRTDEERARTGRASAELREEALTYIALTLAHDDWDEDGRPDHTAGGPHPLERLEDGALWPRQRPWAREVYRRVGAALFDEGHPDEAILAWRLHLSSFPAGCDTPDVHLAIVRAARQLGDAAAVLAALDALVREVVEDPSWRARACPGGADRADALGRAALAATARALHRRAQRERAAATPALEASAATHYAAAIDAYRRFLDRYPRAARAYELAYDLADALFWSGRYAEAAQAYADVRDSPLDGARRVAAARRAAEAERLAAEAAGARWPETNARAPQPVPAALARAARAREIYVRWVRPDEDEEGVRDAFAFNNALLLARHGHGAEARRRFEMIFRARCAGPRASAVGRDALRALLDEAAAANDAARVAALAREVRERGCNFAPGGPPALDACEGPDCLARALPAIETSARLRQLRDRAEALRALPDPRARAERAAALAADLTHAIDAQPDHPDAPAALLLAARLFEQEAGRGEAAQALYERIVAQTPAGDEARDELVAEAQFQLAQRAARAFDYDRALAGYETIARSPRFASSRPSARERRRDALVNAALLSTRLGRHADAARAWSDAAALLPESEARDARLRAA